MVTTAMEHNSVLRPVKAMESAGVSCSIVKARRDGSIRAGAVREAVNEDTRLVVVTAASNVTGAVMLFLNKYAPAGEKIEIEITDVSLF